MRTRLLSVVILMALVTACTKEVPVPKPYTIEVSAGGSLEYARDAARALPASNRVNGVEIVLAPGVYRRSKPLNLSSNDSSVVWRSAAGGRAVICDGVVLSPDSFKSVTGNVPRIDPTVVSKLYVVDLSGQNLRLGSSPKAEFRGALPIPVLYIDGEEMTPAQWPNENWATIARIVDQGTKSNSGMVGDALGNGKKRSEERRGGVFAYDGDRPSRWAKAPKIWLHGFWCFDWYDAVIPVASIDAASHTISLAAQHMYGVRQGNPSPRRWKAVHLLEELDVPGEYYVDDVEKKLYLYPRKPITAESRIVITDVWRNLVDVKGVSDVTFRDIDFTECYGTGAVVGGCTNVVFERCDFSNIRHSAISMKECVRCRVSGCDIRDIGSGAVSVDGGNRKTLEYGCNVVEDCFIKNFSVHCLTYASAIHLKGVGNVARHNELTCAPHMAVGIYGNDHVFEYNIVSNVCMSSDDAAAYYKGRDPSCRGNKVLYNFWSEIGSPRGHGNAAIYFDDGDGGDYVIGNVFYRCGEPGMGGFGTIFSHGGYSNIVKNCIFVECKRPLGSSPWKQDRWESFLKSPLMNERLLKTVDIRLPPYSTHYPELIGYLRPQADELRWNAAWNNVFVNCPLTLPGKKPGETRPGICCGRWYTNSTDLVISEDPGFADIRAKDFRLSTDSKIYAKLPEFKPIPFEKIGLLTPRKSSNGRR